MIKRLFLLALLLFAFGGALSPAVSYAAFDPFGKVCTGAPADSSVCNDSNIDADGDGKVDNPLTGTTGLLLRTARFVGIITGIASLIIVIYGSIKYIVSGGVPAAVESAKNTVLYACVGLVISLASVGIIAFVINRIN